MYHMYVCTARNRLVLPVVGGTRFGLKKFRTDGIRASWISVQVQLERETLARQQPDRCRGKKQSRSTLLRPVVGKNQDNSRYNWNLPCKRISIIPRHPLPYKPGTIDGNWMKAIGALAMQTRISIIPRRNTSYLLPTVSQAQRENY